MRLGYADSQYRPGNRLLIRSHIGDRRLNGGMTKGALGDHEVVSGSVEDIPCERLPKAMGPDPPAVAADLGSTLDDPPGLPFGDGSVVANSVRKQEGIRIIGGTGKPLVEVGLQLSR